jgi:hypothetical protein
MEMKDEKHIKEEIKRFESYLADENKYCVEPDDKGFYKGAIKALK